MKEKDIVEKVLLGEEDVFADVINGFYFEGREVVKPEELREASEISQFKADDGLHHEQTRDVVKYWEKGGVIFSLFGIENQTQIDENMILRVISYDGASYKKQLKEKKIYPVQTLVVYWGRDKWKAPFSLRERIDCPLEVKETITDYSYKLIEIQRLVREELERFHSDFYEVAGIMNLRGDYEPSERELNHPEKVLDLLAVVTDDERYKEAKSRFLELKKEGRRTVKMCEFLDKIETRGFQRGQDLGREEGREEGREDAYDSASLVFVKLIGEGRLEEALKAGKDREYLKTLIKKYELSR